MLQILESLSNLEPFFVEFDHQVVVLQADDVESKLDIDLLLLAARVVLPPKIALQTLE